MRSLHLKTIATGLGAAAILAITSGCDKPGRDLQPEDIESFEDISVRIGEPHTTNVGVPDGGDDRLTWRYQGEPYVMKASEWTKHYWVQKGDKYWAPFELVVADDDAIDQIEKLILWRSEIDPNINPPDRFEIGPEDVTAISAAILNHPGQGENIAEFKVPNAFHERVLGLLEGASRHRSEIDWAVLGQLKITTKEGVREVWVFSAGEKFVFDIPSGSSGRGGKYEASNLKKFIRTIEDAKEAATKQ